MEIKQDYYLNQLTSVKQIWTDIHGKMHQTNSVVRIGNLSEAKAMYHNCKNINGIYKK